MKTSFKRYEKGEIDEVYKRFPKEERKIIDDFCNYCRISAKERKVLDARRSIIQFRDIIQKSLEDSTLEDLRGFLVVLNNSDRLKSSKNGFKIYLKKFLRWKFKDWSVRFGELKDIRLESGFNEKKINSSVILKKEEIEKIIKKEDLLIRKTFFLTLYESGVRPIELREIKWSDINLNVDGNLSELKIFSTKTSRFRVVYVQNATFLLNKLRESSRSVYVFPSREDINSPITRVTAHRWVKEMGEKVKMKIYPYLLRHSRATELYTLSEENKISEGAASRFMGHGKNMKEFYLHLSQNQIKGILTKTIYQLEDLPRDKKTEYEERIQLLESELKKLKNPERSEEYKKDLQKLHDDLMNKIRLMAEEKFKILVEEKK